MQQFYSTCLCIGFLFNTVAVLLFECRNACLPYATLYLHHGHTGTRKHWNAIRRKIDLSLLQSKLNDRSKPVKQQTISSYCRVSRQAWSSNVCIYGFMSALTSSAFVINSKFPVVFFKIWIWLLYRGKETPVFVILL